MTIHALTEGQAFLDELARTAKQRASRIPTGEHFCRAHSPTPISLNGMPAQSPDQRFATV